MKIGFNLLLYTGHVTEDNFALFPKLKEIGYDGVEIPIFDASDPGSLRISGSGDQGQRPAMHSGHGAARRGAQCHFA